MIGDSIESGLGVEPSEAWPALVAADLRWELDNLSVAGSGFVTRGDGDEDYTAQIERAIATKAQIVLIGASDNDLGQDIDEVSAAMTAVVGRLKKALPGAQLIGFSALSGAVGDDQLAPLDSALKSVVTGAGGEWLNLGQPYRGVNGRVQDDGEHPTVAGQQAIASVVLERLDD
ncbi:SGNH/GDSL hydrolase family protein [Leifsonia xyli]|uniref:SGNH/GDSL hydrolase family protein n=1 Tax=Leifsonia xyli TaxID=1575 RepID=UPI00030F6CE1|nr:SGNH/GDSL hydrolase family protein [Leifsonia xyli]